MGLPKNYNETTNLNKRVEALNQLNFYNFNFNVVLTNNMLETIINNNVTYNDLNEFLGEIKSINNKDVLCNNKFSALTIEKAEEKLNESLRKAIDNNIIESYVINGIEEKTFKEELKDKNLLELLEHKGTN
jgi:hypothetical protein